MKRFVSVVLIIVIMIGLNVKVSQASNATYEEVTTNGLFLQTETVGEDKQQFAINQMEKFVLSLPHVMPENIESPIGHEMVALGTPFKLNDIDYFPMCIGVQIVALVSIYENDGDFTWCMSVEFSEGLNEIANMTSYSTPALLYTENGNVYAKIEQQIYPLTDNPEIECVVTEPVDSSFTTINAIQKIYEVSMQEVFAQDSFGMFSSTIKAKYLTLDLKEKQGGQEWCAAFAGAQILRYRGKGDIYAEDIMYCFYPNSSNLNKESLSNSNLMAYANLKGSYPKYKNSTMTMTAVKEQIDADKPIYLGTYGTGIYVKERHALVLRGYNTLTSTYSIWNPWYREYVMMSENAKSISVNGGTFVWDETIYNW